LRARKNETSSNLHRVIGLTARGTNFAGESFNFWGYRIRETVMLRVHTRNLGDAAVLSLQGRLISGETRTLREAVRAQSNAKAIVLDLGRVTAIDAYGLGLMLELRRLSDTKGVRFKLMNVSKFTSRVFEVTRLDSVFEIIPRVEASVMPAAQPRVPYAACA
jgi:anti-anti-sigma factor